MPTFGVEKWLEKMFFFGQFSWNINKNEKQNNKYLNKIFDAVENIKFDVENQV